MQVFLLMVGVFLAGAAFALLIFTCIKALHDADDELLKSSKRSGETMIVYISGKIEGNLHYEIQFNKAEELLEDQGIIALNPATLPQGMDIEKYMPICIAMLDQADAIYMLQGWADSPGARLEKAYAEYQRKRVIYE